MVEEEETTEESSDQSRPNSQTFYNSNYDPRREGKVSAPRSAYGSSNSGQEPRVGRKLNESSSKLAKRRKDVNKDSGKKILNFF